MPLIRDKAGLNSTASQPAAAPKIEEERGDLTSKGCGPSADLGWTFKARQKDMSGRFPVNPCQRRK